jgi:hypothetical protein
MAWTFRLPTILFIFLTHSTFATLPFLFTVNDQVSLDVCNVDSNGCESADGTCHENDQNILIQGKLKVVKQEELPWKFLEEVADTLPSPVHSSAKIRPFVSTGIQQLTELPRPVQHKHAGKIPRRESRESPLEEMALAPGRALKNITDNMGPPRGWFLLPCLGTFFVLVMQCTDVHADSYGMEEEEGDDETRPPSKAQRWPLFDMAKFGLLVGVIWTQLLAAFGQGILASTLDKFVWPAWFLIAGMFGSSLTYESLATVACYGIATNILLFCISVFFTFFNYSSQSMTQSFCSGGAWVLWCLLLYRITLTPLFHLGRSLRIPGLFLLALVHFGSHMGRCPVPAATSLDTHPIGIEDLLLMVKPTDAAFYSTILYAPYFATGLLASHSHWNSLLSSAWFRCVAAVSGMLWCMLTAGPVLCSMLRWRCPEKPWGILFMVHANHLSGYWEDVAWYLMRTSAALIGLCMLFAWATVLRKLAPKFASSIEDCGSRVRYSLVLVVLWYMMRPSMLNPLHLPLQRSRGMTDLAMVCPAVLFGWILTNKGTQKLFQWIIEPYWVKRWIEGWCKGAMEELCTAKRSNVLEDLCQSNGVLSRPQRPDPWIHAFT